MTDKVLDQQWAQKLRPLSVEALTHLTFNLKALEAERHKFLGGETEFPQFDHTHIDAAKLLHKKTNLLLLAEEIQNTEPNTVISSLYCARISEMLMGIQLLQSTHSSTYTAADANESQKNFHAANDFLYGTPSLDIFNSTLARLRRSLRVRESKGVPNALAQEYALLQSLIASLPPYRHRYHFVHEHTSSVDTTAIDDAKSVAEMFQQALVEEGLHTKWRVAVDQSGLQRTFSVIAHKRTISIPGDAYFKSAADRGCAYTIARVRGLIAHEIKTHALRKSNGGTSPLWLLGIGLDRFKKGEEGIATFRQQSETKSNNFAGYIHHLAIGLALGLEPGGRKKHFREMHEILTAFYTVLRDQDRITARLHAWTVCWRIFRGTRCFVPGVVFTKDIFYREANILIHQLLYKFPQAADDFDIGCYDPTRRAHVSALCDLGLLPEFPWRKIESELAD